MTSGAMGNQSFITPFGGRAVQLRNVYSSTIRSGTVVDLSPGCDEAFTLAAAGSQTLIGVVFDDVAAGEYGWVITGGRAQVLLQTGTGCTRTQILTLSASEPGKVVAAGGGVFVGKSSETVAAAPGVSKLVEAVVSTVGSINPASIGPGSQDIYRTFYVNKGAPAGGDGSDAAPFGTIQAAVTAATALVPAPSATAPVVINIGPGVYDENVVVQCDYITLIGLSVETTILTATTGAALCVSNATPASLAVYHVTGNYADLAPQVPPVAAVTTMSLVNLTIRTAGAAARNVPVELLGVAGDSGAGTTDFLINWCNFLNCQIRITTFPGAVASYMYARNCGYVSWQQTNSAAGGNAGGTVLYNSNGWFEQSMPSAPTITYVTGDPQGEPTYGNLGADFLNCYLTDQWFNNEADVRYYNSWTDDTYTTGAVTLEARESHLGFLVMTGTSAYTGYGCTHDGNLDLAGTCAATIYGCYFAQDVIALAGVGTVTESDCVFSGLVADPGAKIIHAGEDRYGVYNEAAGAGSRAIAFAPNFRNGSVLNMTITFEDTGAGYQTGMIATGSLLHTGFTLATGGNGKFHWHAHKIQ